MTDIYRNRVFDNGQWFDFDTALNKKLVNKVESFNEHLINSKGLFVNTIIFHQVLMNYELKRNLLLKLKSKRVKLQYVGLSTSYLLDITNRDKISIVKNSYYIFNKILHFLLIPISLSKMFFYTSLGIVYVLGKSLYRNGDSIFNGENLVLIHSNTALSKCMRYFVDKNEKGTILFDSHKVKIKKKYDDFTVLDIYTIVKSMNLLLALPKLLRGVLLQATLIRKEFSELFGVLPIFYFIYTYSDRFFHSVYFSFVLESFVEENIGKIKRVVSGEKESRFAIIENDISNRYQLEGLCIPHGLEYNFKYPMPLFGDMFYATSNNAKKCLESMYPNIDFLFDESVLKSIYSVSGSKSDGKKIVFFTDSRNIELDHSIISFLSQKFNDIYVKLHPNDLIAYYSDIEDVCFVNSFEDSIYDNIVITRNSTVLLEGIYNDSICISVSLCAKDKFMANYLYPSLHDAGIINIETLESLEKLINNIRENETVRLYN